MNELKDLSRMDESEFVSDGYKLNSAKYLLIVGIEAAIDLCNHLISMNKKKFLRVSGMLSIPAYEQISTTRGLCGYV